MDEVEEVALGDLGAFVALDELVAFDDLTASGDLEDSVALRDLLGLVDLGDLGALAGLDAFVDLLDLAGLVAFVGLAGLPDEVELLAFRISAFLLKGRLYATHATYPTRPTCGTQHDESVTVTGVVFSEIMAFKGARNMFVTIFSSYGRFY